MGALPVCTGGVSTHPHHSPSPLTLTTHPHHSPITTHPSTLTDRLSPVTSHPPCPAHHLSTLTHPSPLTPHPSPSPLTPHPHPMRAAGGREGFVGLHPSRGNGSDVHLGAGLRQAGNHPHPQPHPPHPHPLSHNPSHNTLALTPTPHPSPLTPRTSLISHPVTIHHSPFTLILTFTLTLTFNQVTTGLHKFFLFVGAPMRVCVHACMHAPRPASPLLQVQLNSEHSSLITHLLSLICLGPLCR